MIHAINLRSQTRAESGRDLESLNHFERVVQNWWGQMSVEVLAKASGLNQIDLVEAGLELVDDGFRDLAQRRLNASTFGRWGTVTGVIEVLLGGLCLTIAANHTENKRFK